MTGWLRKVLPHLTASRPPLTALPSTARVLRATKKHHEATIAKADAALRDFKAMDVAFLVVVGKP